MKTKHKVVISTLIFVHTLLMLFSYICTLGAMVYDASDGGEIIGVCIIMYGYVFTPIILTMFVFRFFNKKFFEKTYIFPNVIEIIFSSLAVIFVLILGKINDWVLFAIPWMLILTFNIILISFELKNRKR